MRVNAGQSQLFSTQSSYVGAGSCPIPIEDPERLDDRRGQVGLEPFADYGARIRERSP